jgi:hypothetical protein|tara:strand:+ start:50 stop:340 length:291 start_codon:yes stop_codon:yes gene_type:complete
MSEKRKRKSGAGRKKGSVSFCMVPLTELTDKLPSGAIIVVSRKFCESMGIEGQPVVSTPTMMMPLATAAKANAVQVTDLNASNKEEPAPDFSVDNW